MPPLVSKPRSPPMAKRGIWPGRACSGAARDEELMILDDDVATLLFDILGTVVDEAGSMRAELAAALGEVGAGEQVQALLTGWEQRFGTLVSWIRAGAAGG